MRIRSSKALIYIGTDESFVNYLYDPVTKIVFKHYNSVYFPLKDDYGVYVMYHPSYERTMRLKFHKHSSEKYNKDDQQPLTFRMCGDNSSVYCDIDFEFYYDTLTNVMYYCQKNGELLPMPKPDGTFLTLAEWIDEFGATSL